MSFIEIIRAIFGTIYVLFIPGLILSFLFFDFSKKKQEEGIDWAERIILSIALSMVVVPMVVFILNYAGVAINSANVFLEILGIIILSGIGVFIKNKKS